ncbi:MAG: CocE/NonD family hydrolase [Alphaproteobacteria bacterium]|nr:CocE/NonD family hydrolase [Alphaproteobacteria bacterium]
MTISRILGAVAMAALLGTSAGAVQAQKAPEPAALSETPAKLVESTQGFDFERRDVMIPMRDGVKLHTVILVPKAAHGAPILLTRTPYGATALTSHAASGTLAAVLQGYDNATDVIVEGGYIRVVQDVRGKYGSEGDYVMNRPLQGPLNPTKVDHATDTYDTIDWLVKNTPESNGKVGILGISYDGFLPLMALVNPHPALKVSVPMNPMVDGWMGDDWFHNGAFRQQNMPYVYEQQATRDNSARWPSNTTDDYDQYMRAGSAGELGRQRGLEQVGFWRKIIEHPAYDAFWQEQAMDKILAKQPLTVPIMLVHGLWDQEDIHGAIAVYKALKPKDTAGDKVFLTLGPWYHGQQIDDGSHLGAIKWDADTAKQFRHDILAPFLARYLKDGAPAADIAPVNAFESGTNTWRKLAAWPIACQTCAAKPKALYLQAGGKLSFTPPADGPAFDEYVSDPAKPVPNRARPSQPIGYDAPLTWTQWLVDDQREASGRPDVLTFTTDVLAAPLQISGEPLVNLVASTSGTDSDWVVKLIDVYPDMVPSQPEMGGYQLPVSMDIFRGRYRESFSDPKAITPDAPLPYRFGLPTTNHVFKPGHRIMVQIQSSWFPLYDRNPQTFVPNIFFAKPVDYVKATQRVFHAGDAASFIALPVVEK